MELDTLQTIPTAPNGQADRTPKPGPKSEFEKLQVALNDVDDAIATLKKAIIKAGKCDVPGMNVKRNLSFKLLSLLRETELTLPRGAKA